MTAYGTQQIAPDFNQTVTAVAAYTAIEFVAAFGVQSYLVGPLPVFIPTIGICVVVGMVGLALAALEPARAGGGGFPGPGGGGSPPGFGPTMGLFLIIVALILGCFFYSHSHKSVALALAAGVASALTWGLSVVGALIWSHFVFSSPYWNSWFNLFAAAFAALTVGYAS